MATVPKLSTFEKVSFGFGDVGCVIVWNVIGMFLTIYYTDDVKISAAAVAAIMLSVRIFDGLSDLVMGYVLDHTKSKYGKARPWIAISAPFMAIFLFLCFSVPQSLGETGRLIYAFSTYFFISVVVYTANNLSYCALTSLVTDDQADRASMNSIRFVMTGVLSIILGYVTPVAAKSLGWHGITATYGVIAFALIMLCFFVCKERVAPQKLDEGVKVSFVDSLKVLAKNKYFFFLVGFFVLLFANFGITGGGGMYIARYVLQNDAAFGDITMYGTVASIVASFIFPTIIKFTKGKWNAIVIGFGFVLVGNAIGVFCIPNQVAEYSFEYWIMMIAMAARSIGHGILLVALFAIVADVVEYGEWKSGLRLEGATYSVSSFGFKIGIGIGGALVGVVLAMVDYDPNIATQPDESISAIMTINFTIPMILGAAGLILGLFDNLDKVYPKVMKELAERRARKEATVVSDEVFEKGLKRASEASKK